MRSIVLPKRMKSIRLDQLPPDLDQLGLGSAYSPEELMASGVEGMPKATMGASEGPIPAATPEDIERDTALNEQARRMSQPMTAMDNLKEMSGAGITRLIPFVGDLPKAIQLYSAAKRFESGKASQEDQALLRENWENQYRDKDFGYMVSDIVTRLPAYLGEFMLTGPVYTTARGAAIKGIAGGVEKVVGKEAAKTLLKNRVARGALRAAGSAAGAAAQSAFMPNRAAESTVGRATPEISYESGRGEVAAPGESNMEAALKGLGDNFVEVWTERFGEGFRRLPGVKRVEKVREAITNKLVPRQAVDGMIQEAARRASFQGVLPEIGEEEAGKILSYMLGLSDSYELTTPKQFAAQAVAFSAPGVAGLGTRAGVRAWVKSNREKAVQLAGEQAPSRKKFGELTGVSNTNAEGRADAAQMVREVLAEEEEQAPEVQEEIVKLPTARRPFYRYDKGNDEYMPVKGKALDVGDPGLDLFVYQDDDGVHVGDGVTGARIVSGQTEEEANEKLQKMIDAHDLEWVREKVKGIGRRSPRYENLPLPWEVETVEDVSEQGPKEQPVAAEPVPVEQEDRLGTSSKKRWQMTRGEWTKFTESTYEGGYYRPIPSEPLKRPDSADLTEDGAYMYHYTSMEAIPSIVEKGLGGATSDTGRGENLKNEIAGRIYALKKSNPEFFENAIARDSTGIRNDDWAILRFPKGKGKWFSDPEFENIEDQGFSFFKRGKSISPKNIDVLTENGWKNISQVTVRDSDEHERLIVDAIRAGYNIPPEVLAEYPDLQREAPPSSSQTAKSEPQTALQYTGEPQAENPKVIHTEKATKPALPKWKANAAEAVRSAITEIRMASSGYFNRKNDRKRVDRAWSAIEKNAAKLGIKITEWKQSEPLIPWMHQQIDLIESTLPTHEQAMEALSVPKKTVPKKPQGRRDRINDVVAQLLDIKPTEKPYKPKVERNEALAEFRQEIRRAGMRPPKDLNMVDDFGGKLPPGYWRKDGRYTYDLALQIAAGEPYNLIPDDAPPHALRDLLIGSTFQEVEPEIYYEQQETDDDVDVRPVKDLAEGDLVYRDGEWHMVTDMEATGDTVLQDGDTTVVESDKSLDVGAVIRKESKHYEKAKQLYDAQQQTEEWQARRRDAESTRPEDQSGFLFEDGIPLEESAQQAIQLYGSKEQAVQKLKGQRAVLKQEGRSTAAVDRVIAQLETQAYQPEYLPDEDEYAFDEGGEYIKVPEKHSSLESFVLPSIVKMTYKLMGKYPKIAKRIRGQFNPRGMFRAGKGNTSIEILAELFRGRPVYEKASKEKPSKQLIEKLRGHIAETNGVGIEDIRAYTDYDARNHLWAVRAYVIDDRLAAQVLAHELGHLVDYLPDEDIRRGNILGHIATLKKYLLSTLAESPQAMNRALTDKERSRMRSQAIAKVKRSMPNADVKVKRQEANRIYKELLKQEYEHRRLFWANEIREELIALTKWWKPFEEEGDEKFAKYRKSATELYADAFSILLNCPWELESRAPLFYRAFFNWLEMKPEVKQVYEQIQESLRNGSWMSEVEKDLVNGWEAQDERVFTHETTENLPMKTAWSKAGEALSVIFLWKYSPFRKIGKNLDVQNSERADLALEEHAYRVPGMQMSYYNRFTDEVVELMRKSGIDEATINQYLFYLRVIHDNPDKAHTHGVDVQTAKTNLSRMQAGMDARQWELLEDIRRAFRKIREDLVFPLLRESGAYSDETIEMIEAREYYHHDMWVDWIEKRYGKGSAVRIHQQIGTFADKASPIVGTVLMDMSLIASASWNRVKQLAIANVQQFDDTKVIAAAKRYVNGHFELSQKAPEPDMVLVSYLEDGIEHGFWIDRWYGDLLNETRPQYLEVVLKISKYFKLPFKAVFTFLNPAFWAVNLIRDYSATKRNIYVAYDKNVYFGKVPLPFVPFINRLTPYYVRGNLLALANQRDLPHFIRGLAGSMEKKLGTPDGLYNQLLESGAFNLFESGRKVFVEDRKNEMDIRRAMRNPEERQEIYHRLLGYGEGIWRTTAAIANAMEQAPKIAGALYLGKHKPDMSTREIAHASRMYMGSPPFAIMGAGAQIVNTYLLFWNPIAQALHRDFKVMRKHWGAWTAYQAINTIIPKAFMFMLASGFLAELASKLWGDDDDFVKWLMHAKRVYKGAGDYYMTNYLTIPLGLQEDGKSVLFTLPLEDHDRLIGGMAWKLMQAPGRGVKEMGQLLSIAGGTIPSENPLFAILGAITKYMSGQPVYDSYYGRYVISPNAAEKGGWENDVKLMKWIWNAGGGGLIYRFKNGKSEEHRSTLEKVLDIPLFGRVPSRFIRVTDQGLKEGEK